jgi:hypothetical protein
VEINGGGVDVGKSATSASARAHMEQLCGELKSFGMKQIDTSRVSIYAAQIISSGSR